MSDLVRNNPRADVVYICDKPLDVPDDENLWALQLSTGRIVTSAEPLELRLFADIADVFFEYDADAPLSSLEWAPREWGLTCKKPVTFLPDSESLLPRQKRCEGKLAPSPLFAQTAQGKTPCDPPVQEQKRADPVRVRVCVRPPGVPSNALEWGMVKGVKQNRFTHDGKDYAKNAAKADVIFVYDENAPPESIYYLVKDAKKLSCPGKPAPRPYDEVVGSGKLPMLAEVTSAIKATGDPKKGGGQTTSTSSPDGKGPPLNFVEVLAHNLSIAGALASGDTSGDLKDPNGSRYGVPGGKNVTGPDLLILQAAAGTFAIIGIPLKSGKLFIEKIIKARSEKKVAVILDPKVLSKEIAEELAKNPTEDQVKKALEGEIVESYGMAMAMSLREAGTILPYSRAKIFTAGWEAKFQAHHIYEVNMMQKLGIAGAEDAPAVILSKAEHEVITGELTKARNELIAAVKKRGKDEMPSKAEVWAMYQKVYKQYPNWLKAIEHYFQ